MIFCLNDARHLIIHPLAQNNPKIKELWQPPPKGIFCSIGPMANAFDRNAPLQKQLTKMAWRKARKAPHRAFRHLNAQPELFHNAIGGKDLCPMPWAESLRVVCVSRPAPASADRSNFRFPSASHPARVVPLRSMECICLFCAQ